LRKYIFYVKRAGVEKKVFKKRLNDFDSLAKGIG
jgi:hypothetical protein